MKPDFFEIVEWQSKKIYREFYRADNFDAVPNERAFQSQAVCFVDKDTVVVFKDPNDHVGMPGGHIEDGETFEVTLAREIYEESACKLIKCGPTCYIKEWDEKSPESISFALRYWAVVKPLDEEVNDPCHSGRKRVIISFNEASEFLGWGKSADFLLKLASDKVKF